MKAYSCPFGKACCDGCNYLTTGGCITPLASSITYDGMIALWERRREELMKLPKEELVEMLIGKREHVDEDLEEAAKKYGTKKHPMTTTGANESACDFKAGANWQKEQDQSTIELAEDHAMLAGMNKMEEQMMAKAIVREVKVDAGGYPYIPQMELYDYDKDEPLAKEGDRVKVVVIKEG